MKLGPTLYPRGAKDSRSIHPQGWVPVETWLNHRPPETEPRLVAFTPKGGCPLKPARRLIYPPPWGRCSIHPQGWVPVETFARRKATKQLRVRV